ncbi:50S ribosomal protein L21 [Candidatus Gracilibacteria bacterium]|nr:50S ribosomal protein L21 [Candidatus Gracilibacteria bacterium]
MIAIVKIGGHQALVEVGDTIEVDKLDAEAGKTVKFETLLLSEKDGGSFQVGTPVLEGVTTEAKVLEHGRGDKIRVFKMKPRKRYRRTRGHKQDYTLIEITKIGGTSAKASAPKEKETQKEKPVAEKKPAPKKSPAKTAKTAPKAKAPVKKKK